MLPNAIDLPSNGPYILRDARVPIGMLRSDVRKRLNGAADHEGVVLLTLSIDGQGSIEAVAHSDPSDLPSDRPVLDCRGRHLWSPLSDVHTHLDKTQTWDDAPNIDGTADGAKDAAKSLRQIPWSYDEVYARMEFGVRSALYYGTRVLRTHIDSQPGRTYPSWDAFNALRSTYRGKIELQAVATLGASKLQGSYGEDIAKLAARMGAALGPVIYQSPTMITEIKRAFDLAEIYGLDLDFHVDKTLDADSSGLEAIAREANLRSWKDTILCGHCCSLAQKDNDALKRTIDEVAAAAIAIVVLPTTAIYSLDRAPLKTPRARGLAPFQELDVAGVPVAFATDNCRDSFYPYGDYDLVELFRDTARFGHADLTLGEWSKSISNTPQVLMQKTIEPGIGVGAPADFVLFQGRNFSEVFSRLGAKRQIIRGGKNVVVDLPDFIDLD